MQTAIQLLDDEEIRYQDDQIVVTNRRIIGLSGSDEPGRYDGLSLGDVGPPNKFNGGQHGRRTLGLRALAIGIVIVIAQTVFTDTVRSMAGWWMDAALFLVGSLAVVVGLYLVLNSLFRPAPNTTIIFPVIQGDDIIVSYPEWDNPDAEELMRAFARAKRGIGR